MSPSRQLPSDPAFIRPAPAGPGIGWLRRLGPFLVRYRRPAIVTVMRFRFTPGGTQQWISIVRRLTHARTGTVSTSGW